ncbi:hypothetical protein AB0F72_06060 [Actinoplanes sp. NPDC023936]|uniref:hypothetical protein n=1 Tax=Actinoplanes sp. NPDC023936 TaxID=3154910 RepID=UPI0033C936AA
MVSIGTARTRRPDAVSGSAIVLTANTGVLAFLTAVGALFLLFLFGDEDGTWQRLWPLVAGWVVAAGLATANAVVTVRFARRPADAPRPADAAVALTTAVVATLLLALSASTPGVVLAAAPFALANAAAAWFLYSAGRATAPDAAFPETGGFTESDLDLFTESDLLADDLGTPEQAHYLDRPEQADDLGTPEQAGDRGAPDQAAEPAATPPPALRRRPRRRSRAALHTLRGIQLPRRATIR